MGLYNIPAKIKSAPRGSVSVAVKSLLYYNIPRKPKRYKGELFCEQI
jgi:hypothetical protein